MLHWPWPEVRTGGAVDGANGGNSSKEPAEPSVAISRAAAALLRPRATADSWVILIKKKPSALVNCTAFKERLELPWTLPPRLSLCL